MKRYFGMFLIFVLALSSLCFAAQAETDEAVLIAEDDFSGYTSQTTASQPRRSLLSTYDYGTTITGSGFLTNWSKSSSEYAAVTDTNIFYEASASGEAPVAVVQNSNQSIYRKLNEELSTSPDGDKLYTFSFDVADSPSNEANKSGKDYRFLIGDTKLFVGYSNKNVAAEGDADYRAEPFISFNGTKTTGEAKYANSAISSYGAYPSAFMKGYAAVLIDADGMDKIMFKLYPENTAPDYGWDVKIEAEISELSESISFIGIGCSAYSMMARTKNIQIYECDPNLIAQSDSVNASKPYAAMEIVADMQNGTIKDMCKASIGKKGVSYDSYAEYSQDSDVLLKDINPFNSGYGWASAWSQNDKENFTTEITSGDLKITKKTDTTMAEVLWSQDLSAGYFRKLGTPIDLSKDGEYFAKIAIFQQFSSSSSAYGNHNLRLYLGDDIVFGTKTAADKSGVFPYLSVDGDASRIEDTVKITQGVTYDMLVHVSAKETGEDTVSFMIYHANGGRTDIPIVKIEQTITSDAQLGYFGIKDAAWLTYRIRNIQVECYSEALGNLQTVKDIKTAVSVSEANEATLNTAKTALDALESASYAKRYYREVFPNGIVILDSKLSADGQTFTANVINTGIESPEAKLYMALYDGAELVETALLDYAGNTLFEEQPVSVSVTKRSECEKPVVRIYLWDKILKPYTEPIVFD